MTTSPDSSTPTQPTYAEEYSRLWNEAVTTLTAAVRLRHPTEGTLDFAGFLAGALAAVTGNVGSIERMTAGRPGSWEADLLNQLLLGTLGDDPADLLRARTEPVIVPLNVAQLVYDEWEYLGSPEERAAKLPDFDTAWDALAGDVLGKDPSEEQEQAFDIALTDLRRRYTTAYETYARAFTTAVREEAAGMTALRVPVEVRVSTDPESTWSSPIENPEIDSLEEDEDSLVRHLWVAARTHVGLPTLDT